MDPDKLFGPFARHALRDNNDGGGGGGSTGAGGQQPQPKDDDKDGGGKGDSDGKGGDDKGKGDDADDPKVPQAVIDKLATKIRREERTKARREAADQIALIGKAVGSDKEGGDKTKDKADPSNDVAALREELRLEREFNEAVSELTLTKAQRKAMFKTFQADKPEDADEWVEGWVETWGIGKGDGGKVGGKERTGDDDAKRKKGKRDSDGGGTHTGDVDAFLAGDPTKITPAVYAQLVAKHGEHQANAKVREMVRNFAKAKRG
jgi:hypothetical protein